MLGLAGDGEYPHKPQRKKEMICDVSREALNSRVILLELVEVIKPLKTGKNPPKPIRSGGIFIKSLLDNIGPPLLGILSHSVVAKKKELPSTL